MAFRHSVRARTCHALGALVLLLATAGCSGGESSDESSDADSIIEPEPTSYQFDQRVSPRLAGVSTEPINVRPGDCINHYQWRDAQDFLQRATTIVSCDTPHDREAYHATEHPASPGEGFPLNDELERWAEGECLDHFEDFVGMEYVLSALEIGTILPDFQQWSQDDVRTVICYVHPAEGGRLLESVRNRGI